jgi:dihydroxy-acid dehydratase
MMGAASCDLPAIVVSGGPMLNGWFQGKRIGSGTAVWSMSEDVRAGKMELAAFMEAESCLSRSAGHCMTMGTASTMASMVEALGIGLPSNAAIPAVDARRYVLAHMAGRRIVEMVREDLRMSKILTREAFENAIRINAAIGGSTNAIVHLLAIAGRLGVPLTLDDFDKLGHDMPLLTDLMPHGRLLMEDFYYAGGLPAIIRELGDLLHRDALTVTGKSLGDNNKDAPCWNREVIRPLDKPLKERAGIAVLRGNLCPDGAVIKPSAAMTPSLLKHRGRAVVFETIEDFKARIDDPALDIDENCVMVLKGAGPKGYPGFPELGNLPLPKKVLKKGITDMVRISDARMSGTAYGAVVLHISPESAVGGTLALVKDGDMITLDVEQRRLELEVPEAELARRRAAWTPPASHATRGWVKLYEEHVMQAHQGCDLDFLTGKSGAAVPRPAH